MFLLHFSIIDMFYPNGPIEYKKAKRPLRRFESEGMSIYRFKQTLINQHTTGRPLYKYSRETREWLNRYTWKGG